MADNQVLPPPSVLPFLRVDSDCWHTLWMKTKFVDRTFSTFWSTLI
jgi:hypothetical protein